MKTKDRIEARTKVVSRLCTLQQKLGLSDRDMFAAVASWHSDVMSNQHPTPRPVQDDMPMRRFFLVREHDVSRVSGVGIVAAGVVFPDGSVVLRWMGRTSSTASYACMEDVWRVHSHGTATRFRFLDGPEEFYTPEDVEEDDDE